jgi:cell division protein FtsQ
VFIVIAILFLSAELIWLLGISPFRPFSRIEILGDAGIEKDAILALAGIAGESSYFSIDVRAAERALMGVASIESARVFRHFPNRLQIVIEWRRPVASVLCSVNGRTVPVLFDSHGVVFQIGGNGIGESLHLPVISGLVIEDPVPGMRLPVTLTTFFRELEKIQIAAPELLAAVSEIKIIRKPYDGFDLVLYPVHSRIRVRIPELNEDQLRYTLLMVDVLASQGSRIDSLDFRSGIASYIPKEASSE